jgi:hypothetical protein
MPIMVRGKCLGGGAVQNSREYSVFGRAGELACSRISLRNRRRTLSPITDRESLLFSLDSVIGIR